MIFTAKQIASYINGRIVGDENVTVETFSKIEEGKPGTLSFLANPKYTHYIYSTESSIVLVNEGFVPEQPVHCTLIYSANAYESLAKLMTLVQSFSQKKSEISSLAFIAETAKIGNNVSIAPFAYIGENVEIGDNTIINPHVAIYHDCKIGANCILQAGCVIGADGFGFAPQAEGYEKIPQIGNVVLEDNVEIGANTCIDRATMGSTIIHEGTKLDNLVQIAHNVVVGKNTVMAAQSGVAGSTKLGEWCMIGGQTGITGHINIGDRVQVGAHAGVTGNVKEGMTMNGYPAIEIMRFRRSSAALRNLPEMFFQLHELEKEVKNLKEKIETKE